MSGIEVAGLVLGALPLIISAVEHYESSLDRATAFFKWKDELEKAMRELWIQHSYFEMTLRNLLKEVATAIEIDRMLSDSQDDLWKSTELAESLEEKLGPAYNVYSYTIGEMEGHMKTLAGHLDVERQKGTSNELEAIIKANRPVPSAAPGPPTFEFRRRVKLTMKRKEIRALLKDVRSCNERLDKFIEKAAKFEQSAPAASNWRSSLSPSLNQIQEYATSLHQVLSRVWSCSAHHSHHTHLLLEHRMLRSKGRKGLKHTSGDVNPASFTVSFTNPSQPKQWYVAEIELSNLTGRSPPRVMFQITPPKQASAASSQTLPGQPESLEKLKVIQDLCATICQHPSQHPASLGFCLDLRGSLHGIYQPSNPTVTLAEDMISLEDVLFPAQKAKERKSLTDEDRYILAITLASSLLQLHKTPWISDHWNKRDILFPEKISNQKLSVDVQHPFVMKTYRKESNAAAQTPATGTIYTNTNTTSHDDSINLLSLAKILLEIKFNDRVESRQLKEDLGPNAVVNEATDLQTLKRWVMQEKGNLSFAFRDAISYCMKSFADPAVDLQDPAFRQDVVERVVVPLLEELHYLRDGRSA